MSDATTQPPADVRERVAKEVYLWEATRVGADESWALRRWREESNMRRRLYFNVADRILAILRAPRGEGEIAAVLDAVEAEADKWDDGFVPSFASRETVREIRRRLAALRSEAQGDGWRIAEPARELVRRETPESRAVAQDAIAAARRGEGGGDGEHV
ncbi:MAG TPA: hypothetical protein VF212_10095 [Longimicrobiales bacterium]